MPATVEDLIALFDLKQDSESTFIGPHPNTLFQRLFGGQVLAQSLTAAQRTVSPERPVHSLHAYFLRPGSPVEPLRFIVDTLRDGKSFSARRVSTFQGNREIFSLSVSFQQPEDGLDHSADMPTSVSPPEHSPSMKELLERQFGHSLGILAEWDALDVRLASGARPSSRGGTMRAWVRTQQSLPDDPALHAAVLAYLSDMTLLSVATVQHELAFMSPNVQAASIDHAMWFHRPVRADEWMLYDMVSPSASGARGFCEGRLFQNGLAGASCVQEGLIRVLDV